MSRERIKPRDDGVAGVAMRIKTERHAYIGAASDCWAGKESLLPRPPDAAKTAGNAPSFASRARLFRVVPQFEI